MQNLTPSESVRGARLRFCAWLVDTYIILCWELSMISLVIVTIYSFLSFSSESFSFDVAQIVNFGSLFLDYYLYTSHYAACLVVYLL